MNEECLSLLAVTFAAPAQGACALGVFASNKSNEQPVPYSQARKMKYTAATIHKAAHR
jgi:hypothetical protein